MLCWDASGEPLWLDTSSSERLPYVKGGPHPAQVIIEPAPTGDCVYIYIFGALHPENGARCQNFRLTDFIPSKIFDGSRSGYSFKNGPNGMGYYKDPQSKPAVRLLSPPCC